MIVYTAALRLGGRVVDRPCDVMKRQFVLLSLPLCIPSFRDTYVVFPYSEEVSSPLFLLLFLSSVSLVTAFGHIRQPILAEGHDFAHLPPSEFEPLGASKQILAGAILL